MATETVAPTSDYAIDTISQNAPSSQSHTHDDDKSIPFLRRLRDMLIENTDFISFSPGYDVNGTKILGRIIVHDRIQIEDQILPRYFNHSSFASLRRQLNYFNFVRVGKGRQRESMYINDSVIVLDDILQLKRRMTNVVEGDVSRTLPVSSSQPAVLPSIENETAKRKSKNSRIRNSKRRLDHNIQSSASGRHDERNLVSEDEQSDSNPSNGFTDKIAAEVYSDVDILAGCHALLELASYNRM